MNHGAKTERKINYSELTSPKKIYPRHIVSNLERIENKVNFSLNWEVCVGDYEVTNIWPWEDKIDKISLETVNKVDFNRNSLRNTLSKLYEDERESMSKLYRKKHKIQEKDSMIYVLFGTTPIRNGHKFDTSVEYRILDDRLMIDTWMNPTLALEYIIESSEALGLKTKPFSMTPKDTYKKPQSF